MKRRFSVLISVLNEFVGKLRGEYAGTAETYTVIGWRALRSRLSDAKVVVVRRPISDVVNSSARFVGRSTALVDVLTELNGKLDEISCFGDVKSFTFDELSTEGACRRLFEHCLGETFDREWWQSLVNVNVQVDVPERLNYFAANRSRIESFTRDITTCLSL